MKQGLSEIIIVLDRSGSMSTIKSDMEGGLKTFIEEQKKLPGECLVTLTQFDTDYDVVYSGKPIGEITDVMLHPRGSTALLDAVGRTIGTVGERLERTPEDQRPERILFVIITDGMENASKEFKRNQVKAMIEHQRTKYNWEFVYIGANQDSYAEANNIGVNIAVNFSANAAGVAAATSDLTKGAKRYRSGGSYT